MLDREIGLAGKYPEKAARIPAAGEARMEREHPVDQPDHGADVFAEMHQHEGGVDKDARVVLRYLERLPSEIAGLAPRSFEDIAHAELAADLLHIDRLALVSDARVAGYDEEPADPGECRN